MRSKLSALIPLIVVLSLTITGSRTARAQVSDVSDAFWSIVVPTATAIDIDMGQVLVSGARDSVVTGFLTNTGPAAIGIDSVFFTGTDAGLFDLVSGIPPFEIPQGGKKAVEFRFSPSSTGIKSASVIVHTQIDTLTQTIQGEGILQRIEILTELVDFGVVKVGVQRDTTVAAVVRNTGNASLEISGTAQLGPDDVQFSVLSGGGGFTLAPGESRSMELRFAPTTPGRTSGRLGLFYDGVGSPAIVHLFGEGVQARIEILADTIDFGDVKVGAVKDTTIAAVVRNSGSGSLMITGTAQLGPDVVQFSVVSGGGGFTLAPGESRMMELRFAPMTPGISSGRLGLYHDAAGSPTEVHLLGEGVQSRIQILADTVDFGEVTVGAVKDTIVAAVIQNIGNASLGISGSAQLGPDDVQFSVISGGGEFSLEPGESRTMELRFAPNTLGRTNGRLGLLQSGVGSPVVVHLFGDGKGIQGVATLSIDTIVANVGELVEINLHLQSPQDLALTGATGFYAELRFNKSLLAPFGETPTGTVTDDERTIRLDNLPLLPDAQGVLARLQFIATLGDAEGTPIHLENSFAPGGDVTVTEIPGYFLLSDICREGGTRLFLETGRIGLRQNRPNPFNASTVIEYEVIENGRTRLFVMDLLGRTVSVLVDGVVEVGRYTIVFNASALPSGTYLYVLQTPTTRLLKLMEVVK